jgi:hypothetical protein
MLALIAVLAERSGETVCAAVCLSIGCGWAAAAGAAGCRDALTSPAGPGGAPQVTTMVAIGAAAALLVAGAAAAAHSAAVAHVAALVTFGGAASAAAVAVAAGAPEVETACLAALSSVLVIGAVPRLALALGGVTTSGGTASGVRAIGGRASGVRGSGGHGSGGRGSGGRGREPDRGPPLDARIARADRVLTGTVVGLSLVAVAGGLPAALSTDGWHRSFAIGLGMTLILRSRMFSQVRHVVAVRVGGLLVIAELGVGVAVGDPALMPPMVLGAIALLSVTAVLTAGPGRSPVTYARVGRSLDLAEVALVVMMVLLAAGLLGWFGWAAAVIDRAR